MERKITSKKIGAAKVAVNVQILGVIKKKKRKNKFNQLNFLRRTMLYMCKEQKKNKQKSFKRFSKLFILVRFNINFALVRYLKFISYTSWTTTKQKLH